MKVEPANNSAPLFSWPTRVYWEDTDAGGVVYHARYVAFMERARTEWMRALGVAQESTRQDHDLVFVVRALALDFLRPARLDDLLAVSVTLRRCRRVSLEFFQTIRRGEATLATASVRIAAVGATGMRPRGINDALFDLFKTQENQQSED